MKTAVVAITSNGAALAVKVGMALNADIYIKSEYIDKYIVNGNLLLVHPVAADFSEFVGMIFKNYEGLIFVMACGIVVRTISKYIGNKANDPAVVVCDECGRFAISLLSGHLGGANALAATVSDITGGEAVITTATDVNNVIAFDMFAKENDCFIENLEVLKHVSSDLVNGKSITLYTDCRFEGSFPNNIELEALEKIHGQEIQGDGSSVFSEEQGHGDGSSVFSEEQIHKNRPHVFKENINIHKNRPHVFFANKCAVVITNKAESCNTSQIHTLYLRPRNLILGIGCRKGVPYADIKQAIEDFLLKNNRSINSLKAVASIALKKNETGINDFCNSRRLPFVTLGAEEITPVENNYTYSSFVKEKAGVGGVAEACAVTAGKNATLICKKTIYKGITLALAEEEKVFRL